MRIIYTFLYLLLIPFVLLRLLFRSIDQPDYRKRIRERFGFYPTTLYECIWIHAVSVGESIAALPLIKLLQKKYPNFPILITNTTPTGGDRIRAALGKSVTQVYLPYDLPSAMQRLHRAMHPKICILMETEIWPNLINVCQKNKVPICLLNARLSEKSAWRYQQILFFTSKVLANINFIGAQSEIDAKRFRALYVTPEKIMVTGSIKFDLELPPNLSKQSQTMREQIGQERPVWIAASTHEGEEKTVLKAHQIICQTLPHALLILVPRHPNRFQIVKELCGTFKIAKRSTGDTIQKETTVYLGDTMGEMLLLYELADIAFVGGSLAPIGGHNPIEPAALSKPIVTGPYLNNFKEISEQFIKAKAQLVITDAMTLANTVIELMLDETKKKIMGERALHVVKNNSGALQKQLAIIDRLLARSN